MKMVLSALNRYTLVQDGWGTFLMFKRDKLNSLSLGAEILSDFKMRPTFYHDLPAMKLKKHERYYHTKMFISLSQKFH